MQPASWLTTNMMKCTCTLGVPLTGLGTLLGCTGSMPHHRRYCQRLGHGRRLWLQPSFSLDSEPTQRRDSAARARSFSRLTGYPIICALAQSSTIRLVTAERRAHSVAGHAAPLKWRLHYSNTPCCKHGRQSRHLMRAPAELIGGWAAVRRKLCSQVQRFAAVMNLLASEGPQTAHQIP